MLALIASLSHTDFNLIDIEDFSELLKQAAVPSERGSFVISLPNKQQDYGQEINFELVQQSGHRNKIHMEFNNSGKLTDFHLQTHF
ncbi:hypothetical protein GCM10022409_30130 [Hymenobacter glaciei]|uniref:Uncharacterized protein n=1 Tax=Hymenobacter glaciei TaxID=877209 RepID=A0ABP7UFU1_9BACT